MFFKKNSKTKNLPSSINNEFIYNTKLNPRIYELLEEDCSEENKLKAILIAIDDMSKETNRFCKWLHEKYPELLGDYNEKE